MIPWRGNPTPPAPREVMSWVSVSLGGSSPAIPIYTVTSIEYKFSLEQICDNIFHDAILCDGEKVELLEDRNTKDQKFFLDIRKFLTERCLPEFKLSSKDFKVTNSNLWSSIVFWISDGYSCQRDIFRFANMKASVAMTYFGENNINNVFDISQTMTRDQFLTPSIRKLFDFIKFWNHMVGPDPRHKIQEPRWTRFESRSYLFYDGKL